MYFLIQGSYNPIR